MRSSSRPVRAETKLGQSSTEKGMAKAKKRVFSMVKAVKENARDRIGTVPPERVIPDPKQRAESRKTKHKETLSDLLSKTEERA